MHDMLHNTMVSPDTIYMLVTADSNVQLHDMDLASQAPARTPMSLLVMTF